MLWFLAVIGIAVAGVAAYNKLRRSDPVGADHLVEALREVTTVVVVVAQSVVAALEALARPTRPFRVVSGPRSYPWSDFDD